MQLHNLVIRENGPERISGTCEAGGHAAEAVFDRPTPDTALITIGFGTPPGSPLPPELAHVRSLSVLGQEVPVSAVRAEDGTAALRGGIDPVLVDAVLDAAPFAPEPPPAGRPDRARDPGPGPAPADPPPPPPAAVDPLDAKIAALQAAKGVLAEGRKKLVAMQRLERGLRQQLEDATEDRTEAESALERLQAAAADARRQLIDAIDREED